MAPLPRRFMNKAILILIILAAGILAEEPGESRLCGRSMYLQITDQGFDTMVTTDTAGRTIVRVGSPTAMSLAILKRMGYRLAVMAQYRWQLAKPIILPANKTRYKTAQILVSNYLLEPIDTCIATGSRDAGFLVAVSFNPCGSCIYNGRTLITDTAAFMDISKRRSGPGMYTAAETNALLFRRVFGAYLLLDEPEDLDALVKKVEMEMDRLKLDFSYKTPQLTITKSF